MLTTRSCMAAAIALVAVGVQAQQQLGPVSKERVVPTYLSELDEIRVRFLRGGQEINVVVDVSATHKSFLQP